MRNRIAVAAIILTAGMSLAACASTTGSTPSAPPSTSLSATSPMSPQPSATMNTPSTSPSAGASDLSAVEGTWCSADEPDNCMTVGPGGSPVVAADDDSGAAPCLTVRVGDDGGSAGIYCPKGVSSGVTLDTSSDNTGYDRLFTSQALPYAQTWYRADDVSAATQG